jgi:hypothetical protein
VQGLQTIGTSLDGAMDLAGMAPRAGQVIIVEADHFECSKIVSFLSPCPPTLCFNLGLHGQALES